MIALLLVLGQASAPVLGDVWAHPKAHVLRPMFVYPTEALSHRIADKLVTLAEVQELFAPQEVANVGYPPRAPAARTRTAGW